MSGQTNPRKASRPSTQSPRLKPYAIRQACRLEQLEGRTLLSVFLDTAIGDGGKAITDLGFNETANAITATSDGKVLVAGTVNNAGNADIAVVRYNSDGSLDTTFGNGGSVVTNLGSASDAANAIALGSDGRIYVAGSTNTGGDRYQDFAIACYTSDGVLDKTFGYSGIMTTDFSKQYDQATSIAIQPDGKILLGGFASVYGRRSFAVARYNPDGRPDETFGTGGKTITPLGASGTNAEAYAMVLQGDKILLAGATIAYSPSLADFALVRYNSNGSLDSSFGSGGSVVTNMGFADEEFRSVAIAADGSIIAAGRAGNDLAALRYSADGVLDTSFGSNGMTRVDISGAQDKAAALSLKSNGKIVVAGTSGVGVGSDFALVQLNANGVVDTTFGNGGKFIVDVGSATDIASGMTTAGIATAANGDFVVTGSARLGASDDFATVWIADSSLLPPVPPPVIPPPNTPPIADPAGPYTVDEGSIITLDDTGSIDPDGTIVRYEWDYDYDPAFGFDINATGPNPIFDASRLDGDRTMIIALRVTDDKGASTIATTQLLVRNVAPTANAGDDHTAYRGDVATFFADFSDPCADDLISFAWTVTDPAGAVVASGDTMRFDFVPTVLGNYTVTLTIADDDGGVGTDSAILHVINRPPVADAGGSYIVGEGREVVLSAANSYDTDGSIISYEWDLNYDGAFAADTTGKTPALSALNCDGPTTVTVALRVTDDNGDSSIATAVINVGNLPPIATITGIPAASREGDTIRLAASASDPSPSDTLSLSWLVSRNGSIYATGTGSDFSFTPDDNGEYIVTLTATDDDGGASSVFSVVNVVNAAPIAAAGPDQAVQEGDHVLLSGQFADAGPADTHTLSWQVVDAAGQLVASGNGATLDFAPAAGQYLATFTVTDDDGASNSDTLTITAEAAPPPVDFSAFLSGATNGVRGQPLSFSGSFTAANGNWLVSWDFGDGTTIANQPAASALMPSHVFAATGTYQVQFTVTDGNGFAATAQTIVNIGVAQLQADSGMRLLAASDDAQSLVVGGTTGKDIIVLRPHGPKGVAVYVNWQYVGVFAPTGRIIVYTQQGPDVIWARGIKAPITVAGDGNDTLITEGRNTLPKVDSMRNLFNLARKVVDHKVKDLIDGLGSALKKHK